MIHWSAKRNETEVESVCCGHLRYIAELDDFVKDYAETIAGNAPMTIASIKNIVGEIVKNDDDRNLATCEAMVKACFDSQDYIEGRRAFMEKRTPNFVGK